MATFEENLAKAREFGGTGMEPYLEAALDQYKALQRELREADGDPTRREAKAESLLKRWMSALGEAGEIVSDTKHFLEGR